MERIGAVQFCGRRFSAPEVSMICEVVDSCGGIERKELARTVCELLDFKRVNGRLKTRECRDLLERLEAMGLLRLPAKKATGGAGPRKRAAALAEVSPCVALCGRIDAFGPVDVRPVIDDAQRRLFCELVGRHHYLGYAPPFGARLQYLVYVHRPRSEVVGCVQFSSPAWRMKVRDAWIGWDDGTRQRRLQRVVSNSRLLVLAPIRNLASSMLAAALRRMPGDWQQRYGLRPLLVETLVDRSRYHGGCYRAANWIELGPTSGRGRMDRANRRQGAAVKTVLVYPLVKDAAARLRQER
jgi:hypothetical protein